MVKYRITYSDKRIKGETISAKNKLDAMNKARDVPGAFFKIKLLKGEK